MNRRTKMLSLLIAGSLGITACVAGEITGDKFSDDPDAEYPEPMPFPSDDDDVDPIDPPEPPVEAIAVDVDIRGGFDVGPNEVESRVVADPEATSIKLHFATLTLQPGDELLVVDTDGVVQDRFEADDTFPWAFAVDGTELTVELRTGSATGSRGYVIDTYQRGVLGAMAEPEPGRLYSTCGARDDYRDVACFGGDPDIRTAANAVATLRFGGVCTGWLVSSEGHLITNNHCISSQGVADRAEFVFYYETASCGGGGASREQFRVKGAQLVTTSRSYDFSLLKLRDNPAERTGWLTIEPESAPSGEGIYIVQHPRGSRKQVAVENEGRPCTLGRRSSRSAQRGHQCDTQGGSSGSPVLSSATNRVVALHNLGGCSSRGGSNSAVDASLVYREIARYLPDDTPTPDPDPDPDPTPDPDPAPDPGPAGTAKTGSLNGLLGPDDSETYFIRNVVPGSRFVVRTEPRSGAPRNADIDLFIGYRETPTRSDFDAVDGNATASEVVTGTVPDGTDTIYILVDGYAGDVPFTISAEWVEAN